VHNKARGSTIGANVKTDSSVSHPHEEDPIALGKHFKCRPGHGLPADRSDLCEEAVAVAHDFENAVRQLVPPRVVIQEPGIHRNLGVLFWRIKIGKRRLRVQEMKSDVIDPAQSKSI